MDDYEINFDLPCPHCESPLTHRRDCNACEDGFIDEYEDDPLWFEPGDVSKCRECNETGVLKWCPKCGKDLHESVEKVEG